MLSTDNMVMSRRMCRWRKERLSCCSRISSERQMKIVCPKMKEKEFEFHQKSEKGEKWNRSKRNGLSAVTVPRILLRESRGLRGVDLEELKCPERAYILPKN